MKLDYKLLILILLISISVISCSNISNTDIPEDIGEIKIGYLPISASAPVFIALEKGYFEEEGIHVTGAGFQSSSFMMPILATGDLDVGIGQTGTDLFNAFDQGLDIEIVGPFLETREGYAVAAFVVRKDLYDSGKITEIPDLKGAVIATNVPGGVTEYFYVKYLEMGGLTLDDIELVTMRFPDMNVALANQAIDFAMLPEPFLSSAVNAGYVVVMSDVFELVGPINSTVLLFGKRMLEHENHEVGVRFFKAYLKAARELILGEGLSDKNVEIISKYTNTDPAQVKSGGTYYYDPNGNLNMDFIEDLMMYLINQGYTDFSEPLDLTNYYDSSYVQEAVDRLGRAEE
jgi:NitT/TauT family transport system substrate-binding protein